MPAYVPVGLILFMLAPTGCESPSGPKGLTVTDSAGVRIMELGPDLDGVAERRVLADEPDWVIRSREDDPSFVVSKVMDVELLSLRRLAWLAFKPPDSLGVGDFGLRRVTVFDVNGQFVRSFETASTATRSSITGPPRPIGLLSDGSVVTAAFESAAPVEGSQRPGVEVAVIPPSGDGADVVGTWPGDELSLFLDDGRLQVVAPPFGRRLHIAPSPDGVWLGDDDLWEIRDYSAGGHLRAVVRSTASPRAVPVIRRHRASGVCSAR